MGRRRRKPNLRAFTLIELFIALSVLALLGGIVLFRTKPMLDHYRFNRSVERLKQEISHTRRLARTSRADIEFHVYQHPEGLSCIRKTDEPLHPYLRATTPLSIPHLEIKEKDDFFVTFTASGWVKEEKQLIVCSNGNFEVFSFSNYLPENQ